MVIKRIMTSGVYTLWIKLCRFYYSYTW